MTNQKKVWSESDKKDYAQKRKNEMNNAIEQINLGVQSVFKTTFKDYLNFISSFHKYSVNNLILIYIQNSKATMVASYKDWEKKGRHVKRGEKGIYVIVPTPVKIETLDETGELLEKTIMRFKKGYVFDISQTEGEDVPTLCKELSDSTITNTNKLNLESIFKVLENITGFDIEYGEMLGSESGYCSPIEKKIVLKKNTSTLQTFETLIHECSHALNIEKNLKNKSKEEKANEEIIAESVSYVVLKHFGYDTNTHCFEYIASWSQDKKQNELKSVLENIRSNSNILIDALEN